MSENHQKNVPDSNEVPPPSPPAVLEIPTAKLKEINVTDYMQKCIDKVAIAQGFENYDIEIIHGSAIGDGFVGLIFRAIIQEKNKDKQVTVVLKSPPEGGRRHDFKSMVLFEREVLIYKEILPALMKFQKEKKIDGCDGFFSIPEVFFADYDAEKDESLIIMEDLKENGYKLWDKFTPTNYEHAKQVMAALGKFHAVSLAMKVEKPEAFEKFKTMNDIFSENFFDENFSQMFHSNIDRAAATLPENYTESREKVLGIKDDVFQLMKDMVNPQSAEPFTVLTHGDCWSNNFMYRYKGDAPSGIVLLDWQISRYSSPALDLLYFIFNCTNEEMRANHYKELIELYHKNLSECLEKLTDNIKFPFEALKYQLKKFGKFAILMASMVLPVLTTRNEDLVDMDFLAENMKTDDSEMQELLMKSFMKTNKDYDERMRSLIMDIIRNGYL